ncbi:DUF4199 domain-containing protein [Aquimarina macrocephali]|uniref:DUF4199 domain-containing protein n=1 Tax=Aquimarina macrocephali TaxID=666563 RepID=UPI000464731F|nr:DUF4199 domain-containing protein [Aquimarina macrocephali]
METNDISTKKYIIKYGLISGIAWIALGIIRYLTIGTSDSHWLFSIIELVIHITPIFFGIREYRLANSGFLKYGAALKIGFCIALIGCFISIIWDVLLLNLIEPNMMNQRLESQRQQMILDNPGLTLKEVHQEMAVIEKYSYSYIRYIILLTWRLSLGFIFSLIAGAIMHKKQNL